jgi:hypothetical protein
MTVMSRADPWSDIDPDTLPGTLHARRADATHPHDFFWGRDVQGHRLLIYQSINLVTDLKLPSLRGVNIELKPDSLILRLTQHSDLEIFATLCWSLIERTRGAQPGSEVLVRIIEQLERWQRFLGKGNDRLLSDEQIRGLFCELKFLACELIPRFSQSAIAYWHGPAGDPQDFAVGTTLFEIKSHTAGSAPVLMISSAEQLWHEAGELFLVAYTIGESSAESSDAQSLSSLVLQLRTLFNTADTLDIFEDRLMEVGYIDHPEYERKFFTVSAPESYLVGDDFPRITKNAVMPGVCRVKYAIELSACIPYKAIPDWVSLGATNGH